MKCPHCGGKLLSIRAHCPNTPRCQGCTKVVHQDCGGTVDLRGLRAA